MADLLCFTCWIQSRYEKNLTLSVKIAKRIPIKVKNYTPGTKIHMFDSVKEDLELDQLAQGEGKLPVIQIKFKETIRYFDLNKFKKCDVEPHVEVVKCPRDPQGQDFRILFNWEVMSKTKKLYERYCNERQDIEKHYYCQGVKDFIRSEQQFLAQFDKNQEMDELRQLEVEQSSIQAELCQQIINTKKFNVSISKILLILLLFIIFGHLFGRNQKQVKGLVGQMFQKGKPQRSKKQKKQAKKIKIKDQQIRKSKTKKQSKQKSLKKEQKSSKTQKSKKPSKEKRQNSKQSKKSSKKWKHEAEVKET